MKRTFEFDNNVTMTVDSIQSKSSPSAMFTVSVYKDDELVKQHDWHIVKEVFEKTAVEELYEMMIMAKYAEYIEINW